MPIQDTLLTAVHVHPLGPVTLALLLKLCVAGVLTESGETVNEHVPLCVKTWGLSGAEIDKGVDGPNVAAVHFKFDSLDALQAAMGSEGTGAVLADVANYTSIAPVLQTSEVVA